MTQLRFDHRDAVVTGAGRGIGEAHAKLLASRGASVVVNDVDRAESERVASEIVASGGTAIANADTVASAKSAANIIGQAIDAFGHVDVVINNAGIVRYLDFPSTDEQVWRELLDVHLMGSVFVTQAAWPHMVAQNYVRLLNLDRVARGE